MKTLAQYAAEHLREVGVDGIMYGDVMLTHEILDRAKRPHRGYRSNRLLLNALEGSELFEKKLINVGGRGRRSFNLKDG
jgi:hypothetical protein